MVICEKFEVSLTEMRIHVCLRKVRMFGSEFPQTKIIINIVPGLEWKDPISKINERDD